MHNGGFLQTRVSAKLKDGSSLDERVCLYSGELDPARARIWYGTSRRSLAAIYTGLLTAGVC